MDKYGKRLSPKDWQTISAVMFLAFGLLLTGLAMEMGLTGAGSYILGVGMISWIFFALTMYFAFTNPAE